MSLIYRNKGSFLQRLHTGVLAAYLGALFVTPVLFDHPLALATLLGLELAVVVTAHFWEEWKSTLPASVWTVTTIIALNLLLSRAGHTTLLAIGQLKFTLESLCYGAAMGLRLVTMFTACWLGSVTVNPDRLLSLVSKAAGKLALIGALATRMVPLTFEKLNQAQEALEARGVSFHEGRFLEKLKRSTWLLDVLVFAALESSLDIAEAMFCRGFGCSPRSRYAREVFAEADFACLAATMIGLGLVILAKLQGAGSYQYFPRMAPVSAGWSPLFPCAAGAYLFPVALAWGYNLWLSLYWKT
ncbi:MAG: energy-coupling factor transporter transmembrane component T [Bacillota bacterium]